MAITDTERLAWLVAHVTYLEHTDKEGRAAHQQPRGGYWPQSDTDPVEAPVEEMIGLGLLDYIDRQIAS